MDRLPSVMNHNFSQVPQAEIPRSSFDRSHGLKTTFDAGVLVPIFVDEALPGDTFNVSMAGFGRLATPIFPIMDNIFLNTFFFAVPYRLIWDNFQRFMGEQRNPGDSTDYLVPQVNPGLGGFLEGSLPDYFGLPTKVSSTDPAYGSVSALPFRAYNLIWNEWFRDENLQPSAPVFRHDGPDASWIANYYLRRRGKRHDYFTSALPWPQKGDAVSLGLAGQAPISGLGVNVLASTSPTVTAKDTFNSSGSVYANPYSTDSTTFLINANGVDGDPQVFAELAGSTAITVNALREAFQIQKLYERDARGGTRYTEIIRSHFGVTSPDARLQRPEYLGGGQSLINLHEVPQTSSTDETTPQGNLSAYGTVSFNGHGFTKSFTEHCVVIGLASVRADLTYQQGVDRMWSRQTRWDFYWPALAHLGEQAVLNKEIYQQRTLVDDEVFGYQERFAEYRYKPSKVTGAFRSNHSQSLDAWHLSQDFDSLPTLSPAFIQENPPLDRVIAVPSQPHIIFDAYFKMICARPMPVYSVPGLIDHF